MNRLLATILLAAAPLTAFSQNAGGPDANTLTPPSGFEFTPAQTKVLADMLNKAQDSVGKSRVEILSKPLATFKAALAGSDKDIRDLYLACYKTNHFDKKDAKDVDFAEWRVKNEDKFKDPAFLQGVHLQLEYLVITMQNQDAKDMGPAIGILKTFMSQELNAVIASTKHNQSGAVSAVVKPSTAQKQPTRGRPNNNNAQPPRDMNNEVVHFISEPVRTSEFAKAYLLEDVLNREGWEYVPVNFGGIFRNTIFPYIREKKPSDLASNWDLRMDLEFNYHQAILSNTEYTVYWAEKRPERLWEKAKDLFTSNIQPASAVRDMVKVVQDYPTHPHAVEWITSLRELMNQTHPAVLPTPAATEPPATADATTTPTPTPGAQ